MPYFKITPHPLLVESEDAESAAIKARELILRAPTYRYEIVGPDGAAIWVNVPAGAEEVTAVNDPALDETVLAEDKDLEEPQVAMKPGILRRLLNKLL